MEICLPVWKHREFIDAHRYDHTAVTTLLLVTTEETRLEDLLARKVATGDIGATANTILVHGQRARGHRLARMLCVVKHRGSAMSDEIVEYRDRGRAASSSAEVSRVAAPAFRARRFPASTSTSTCTRSAWPRAIERHFAAHGWVAGAPLRPRRGGRHAARARRRALLLLLLRAQAGDGARAEPLAGGDGAPACRTRCRSARCTPTTPTWTSRARGHGRPRPARLQVPPLGAALPRGRRAAVRRLRARGGGRPRLRAPRGHDAVPRPVHRASRASSG